MALALSYEKAAPPTSKALQLGPLREEGEPAVAAVPGGAAVHRVRQHRCILCSGAPNSDGRQSALSVWVDPSTTTPCKPYPRPGTEGIQENMLCSLACLRSMQSQAGPSSR